MLFGDDNIKTDTLHNMFDLNYNDNDKLWKKAINFTWDDKGLDVLANRITIRVTKPDYDGNTIGLEG